MNKFLKGIAVTGVVALTAGSMSSVMFAQVDGETRLTAEACDVIPTVEAYDIDYGSFLASEVQGTTHINAGTKAANTLGAGSERTPSNTGAAADYYVYITASCPTNSWDGVTVQTSQMVEDGTLAVQPTAIPADAQRLESATDGTVYLFNGAVANAAVSQPVVADETTLDSAQTVLSHDGTDNGIAGDYGALLSHEIVIPANQVPATYEGTYTVTCVNCI